MVETVFFNTALFLEQQRIFFNIALTIPPLLVHKNKSTMNLLKMINWIYGLMLYSQSTMYIIKWTFNSLQHWLLVYVRV